MTRCASCATRMCDACFRFVVADDPACVRCAHEVKTRARRGVSFGIFLALITAGGTGAFLSRSDAQEYLQVAALLGGCVGVVLGAVIAVRASRRNAGRVVRARAPEDDFATHLPRARQVRAAHVRRAIAALTPGLSGRATTLATLAAMTLTACAFPALLRLPRWLELETILGAWWLMAWVSLGVLLYRGTRIEDDHFFYAPRLDTVTRALKDAPGPDGCSDPGCSSGCDDVGAGIVAIAAIGFVLLLCLLAAWVVVEIALPLAFLAFYVALSAALRRAARDRHDCRDHLARAMAWSGVWATVYLAPVAALVWAIHRALLQ